MNRRWVLGIDFGTTSMVAAASWDGRPEVIDVNGERRTPSAVYVDATGRVIVGQRAERLGVNDPGRMLRTPKARLGSPVAIVLGGKPYPIVSLVAASLRAVYDEAVRSVGSPPVEVRLSHPAAWASGRRDHLLAAALAAELPNPTLIPEPVAAAIAFAADADIAIGSHVLVYDLGGGTFDCAVVRSEPDGFVIEQRPVGDNGIGGELFDELVVNHVGQQLDPEVWEQLQASDEPMWLQSAAALRAECRKAKEFLSLHETAHIQLALPTGVTNRSITRDELDDLLRPHIAGSIRLAESCVDDARLSSKALAAVFLVGGASRSPIVQDAVSNGFPGVPLNRRGDPKAVVAIGASLAAKDARGWVYRRGPSPGDTVISGVPAPAPSRAAGSATSFVPPPVVPRPDPVEPAALRRSRGALFAVAASLAVVALGVGAFAVLGGDGDGTAGGSTTVTQPTSDTAAPVTPADPPVTTTVAGGGAPAPTPQAIAGTGLLEALVGLVPGDFDAGTDLDDGVLYRDHAIDATLAAVLGAVAYRQVDAGDLGRAIREVVNEPGPDSGDIDCNAIGDFLLADEGPAVDCVPIALGAAGSGTRMNIDGLSSVLAFGADGRPLSSGYSVAGFDAGKLVASDEPTACLRLQP